MKKEEYQSVVERQKAICKKYGAEYVANELSSKLGISAEILAGGTPVHGLRHPPQADTCGWYIWSGEYSEGSDFFHPIHVEHVVSGADVFVPYMGLAPGWRFLIDESGYEDVWFDPSLLEESP